jgi:hypothetical protein
VGDTSAIEERDLHALPIAVRVWATRTPAPDDAPEEHEVREGGARQVRRRYPTEALIFDTETAPGPAQPIWFLVWRLYRDAPDSPLGHYCVEEGIAFADDLPQRDPEGFKTLRQYVADPAHEWGAAPGLSRPDSGRALVFKPVSWWLQERLFLYGYRHRNRCAVVGFNLPFDFGRLASYWAPARGFYRGGWSLGLWGEYDEHGAWHDRRFHPRLLSKAIDPRRTLFAWGTLKRDDRDDKGAAARMIDLRTLSFALTDKSLTLEAACKAFGDDYEKAEVGYDRITPELVSYAREDVEHTATLYRNTVAELARHEGVDLQPHQLFSPATVGARYMTAMGLSRPLEQFTDAAPEELGWRSDKTGARRSRPEGWGPTPASLLGRSMTAFFGGRAEARIVRTPVPIAYVDFTSMYPSVNANLGTWELLRSERIEVEDAAEHVQELLNRDGLLERALTKDFWREMGVTLVELAPDGDVLPVRGVYDPTSDDYGIGVNPLRYDGTLWYALPDVVAAVLLGDGRVPEVLRALRLRGHGCQPDLKRVRLRGGSWIDPARDNPFVAMINERQRVRADDTLPKAERDRLELFLKITANATAYGVLARFDRRELADAVDLKLWGPDPRPLAGKKDTPEDPGPFCFPPIAAAITAGARLKLALLERLVRDAGGSYAFCDTDSLGIVASERGGPIACQTATGEHVDALPWSTVRELLGRFHELNPYEPELVSSAWKAELDSLDRQLWCYAISAKRYCLYRVDRDGRPMVEAARETPEELSDEGGPSPEGLEDWSEHGLGLYLDPIAQDPDRPRRDAEGRKIWVRQAWQSVLNEALDGERSRPGWTDTYALTRFTLSSPKIAAWFDGYNAEHPDARIGPGSFGLIAHPASPKPEGEEPLDTRKAALPAAPFESDPAKWPQLDWYDRRTGEPLEVLTPADRDDPERFASALATGALVIQDLGFVLGRYGRRAEHKSLAPDGGPADRAAAGLLERRAVESSPALTDLTGKEGNKLAERLSGTALTPAEYRNDYGARANRWDHLVRPILTELGASHLLETTGFGPTAVYDVLRGTTPHPGNRARYERIAMEHATTRLAEWEAPTPANRWALLWRYLDERARRGQDQRRCEWCGAPMPTALRADARYHTDACRKAAQRARTHH